MAGSKRDRQKQARQAKLAALAAARRRQQRKRTVTLVAVSAAVVVGLIVLFNVLGGEDGTEVTSGSSTTEATTATAATGSAAGKPCVPVADPLPAGAPAVAVKTGVPVTSLVKEDLKVGTGAEVTPGATVTANYIGVSCSTGKIFDSSYSRGQPTEFSLTQVIKGWTDGIPGMKVGGQRLLGIPSDQAYGAQGRAPSILPDEALWFVVEITATKPA